MLAGMVTGGFSGIAIIVKAGTKGLYGNGVPLWVTNLVLNVPVFILAAKIKGFSICKKSSDGRYLSDSVAGSSAGMEAVRRYFSGSVIWRHPAGCGIGLVFLGGGTTGGTDLLAAIIQKYMKHYSIAQVMQFVDGAVVVAGMYVFGVERALYAIIAVYLVTKVSDGIIAGLKFFKSCLYHYRQT